MSFVADPRPVDALLSADVLAHLARQLESARRMLAVVREQGAAIRRRAVQDVVRCAGALQVEMHRRESLEVERTGLLARAAGQLEVGTGDVSLTVLAQLMEADAAEVARERSGELRQMLSVIAREHATNRALMQQELAFLDHLLRLAGAAGAYDAGGEPARRRPGTPARRRMFDCEA